MQQSESRRRAYETGRPGRNATETVAVDHEETLNEPGVVEWGLVETTPCEGGGARHLVLGRPRSEAIRE
ncbi:hypothetical protein [Salinigranum sp. GCM10025319]|uniref:hypothetical protein n=1 Tax=Salinigranum sp. GCM10025319 TaxID=3252687 RepID=UPI00360F0B4F